MAHLKITNLKKSFNASKILDNISFEVAEGQFCILLGPSGCGKTTILRIIAGLEQQDEGKIYIGSREVSNLTPRERDIAMVFQSYALYPHMNVHENMAFSLRMQKKSRHEIDTKVRETAHLLGLHELLQRKPKELSGGQRQRVAIGRAIVRNPTLFLFDEPLSNLDATLRSSMRIEIARLHQKLKATTIYVTHDQVEAMTLGQKIVLIDKGVIRQIGTPDNVYHNPSNIFTASFIGTPTINLVRGRITIKKEDTFFIAGNFTLTLECMRSLKSFMDQEITMAIRPECLVPGAGPLTGIIEFTEHLGPETLIYLNANGVKITAKVPPDSRYAIGEELSLSIDNRGVYFFHDGKRIILP